MGYYPKYKKCNKPTCRVCREGKGHGPYWFSSATVKGRTVETYLGRQLPVEIGRAQQGPLVGRDEELNMLRERFATIKRQAGKRRKRSPTMNLSCHRQCVVLMGDAGIGKTRLAEEAAREAGRRNWAVVWCRTYTQESSVPYRLWTETLRKAMSQGLWQRQEVTRHPQIYQPLRVLLPELQDLLPPTLQTIPHEQEQLRLWESICALLNMSSESSPLLIVLDDLQWADSSSCELLTYLVRQMRGQPVLFLGTCRDTEVPANHPLRGLFADLHHEQAVELIPVKPLNETDLRQLIGHLPEPVLKRVSDRASGNPFFAEELARSIASGSINLPFDPANSDQLPDTIQAVLDLRLARISPKCQRILERGAVLGDAFRFDVLCGMARSGHFSLNEDEILDLLEEALQAGMLTEDSRSTQITYHFWHPLLSIYLYDRLSAARRASLHRHAAQALQSLCAGREAEFAAQIADHLEKGRASSLQIIRFAELAASYAYSLSAYQHAEKYSRLALAHRGELAPTAPQAERLHYAALLERLGECLIVLGKFEDAQHCYAYILQARSAPRIYRSEEEQQYEAQIKALIWVEISKAWRHLGDSEKATDSLQQSEEILHEAGVIDGPAWARIRYQQGHTFWLEGRLSEALTRGKEALALFQGSFISPPRDKDISLFTQTQRILHGDPVGQGRAYTLLAGIEATFGQNKEALNHLKAAAALFEQYRMKREIAIAASNQGDIYLRIAEYEPAKTAFQQAQTLAEEIGDRPTQAVGLINLGIVSARLGCLAEAETQCRQALALAVQVNERFYISLFHSYLAVVLIEQGKLNEAAPLLLQALKISHSHRIPPCIGFALVTLGQWRLACFLAGGAQGKIPRRVSEKDAKHLLRRAQTSIQRALAFEGLETDTIYTGRLLAAKCAFLLGERGCAYDLAANLLKESLASDFVWLQARAQVLLAQIMMDFNQQDGAQTLFQQAILTFTRTGMRLDHARALQVYATSLLTCSDNPFTHEQAQVYLEEARKTFEDCQAGLDLHCSPVLHTSEV